MLILTVIPVLVPELLPLPLWQQFPNPRYRYLQMACRANITRILPAFQSLFRKALSIMERLHLPAGRSAFTSYSVGVASPTGEGKANAMTKV
jgi:hypothetical protein